MDFFNEIGFIGFKILGIFAVVEFCSLLITASGTSKKLLEQKYSGGVIIDSSLQFF